MVSLYCNFIWPNPHWSVRSTKGVASSISHHDLDGVIPEDVQLTQDYIVCNTEQGVCQAHLFRNIPKNIDY